MNFVTVTILYSMLKKRGGLVWRAEEDRFPIVTQKGRDLYKDPGCGGLVTRRTQSAANVPIIYSYNNVPFYNFCLKN